ncbi:hypothetical protein M758_UG249200 [Ceratodon purpureus]|nr:hypothetical protein M758_UG249200 [Ceratodon purpureus]
MNRKGTAGTQRSSSSFAAPRASAHSPKLRPFLPNQQLPKICSSRFTLPPTSNAQPASRWFNRNQLLTRISSSSMLSLRPQSSPLPSTTSHLYLIKTNYIPLNSLS